MTKKNALGDPDNPYLQQPRGAGNQEEEDYKVADLSAVPIPKIEFVMPNLTPVEGARKKLHKKVKELKKTEASSSANSTLTGEQLNNKIVSLRPVIDKARKFLAQRLIRKMKRMEVILSKKTSDMLKRKVERFEEEIHYLKKIKKDEVSKFALLNKKNLDQLRITDKTAVDKRCLYKLACEPLVIKAVEQYRKKYPSWEATTAFLLQRLGLQYASVKNGRKVLATGDVEADENGNKEYKACKAKQQRKTLPNAGKNCKMEKPSCAEKECSEISEDDNEIVPDDDLQIGSDSEDEEEVAVERRRKLLLGPVSKTRIVKGKMATLSSSAVCTEATKKSLPTKAIKRLSQSGTLRTAVVKKVNLNKQSKIRLTKRPTSDERYQQDKEALVEAAEPKSDSFFLPASSSLSSSGNLHPSWAAKRLAKERQLVAPQSKRIVFHED